MPDTTIVIPCFNEAQRLDLERFAAYLEADGNVRFEFVDDGSTDGTREVLARLQADAPDRVSIRALAVNGGKAEAVRTGIVAAIDAGASFVGYWDADLATPLEQIGEFRRLLVDDERLVGAVGSRIKRLGANIERRAWRHYLGRVFATLASLVLGLGVYDTQCGAKLFRVCDDVADAFGVPFTSRWFFDVEVFARLEARRGADGARRVADTVLEVPLPVWHDRSGSKLRPWHAAAALFELPLIRLRYRRGQRRASD